MQFFTVTPVLLERRMPDPVPGPVMECPAQSRVMLSAPIVMPINVAQFKSPVSVVLLVIVSPHETA